MFECSLTIIHLHKYHIHQIQTRIIRHNRIKYFWIDFRYSIKKIVIASNNRTAIHARDRVEKINSQKIIVGNTKSFQFFFLEYHNINTGKNAISQNQKLVGLSNKNWFLTCHLSINV